MEIHPSHPEDVTPTAGSRQKQARLAISLGIFAYGFCALNLTSCASHRDDRDPVEQKVFYNGWWQKKQDS